ncbi:M24 family metallopeptidase [Microlunatus panaciterrae]|uniref:Xaa-Pro aminopeptidase n=1 Tax=Microlunatus panaciterrae TaxID=400768 RepID=A0ABS2RHF7_9ACTN|nr:M24 family metallopeptidase [Microlunatus panaciterrae]MBM7798433.1 Xaa-Pro aminopeptidase [Microlunatus panaciterrae]
MTDLEEHQIKRDRLLKILADHGADRLLLTSQTALAWYLEGARIHVSLAAPPIVALLVSSEADELILTSNEADRLVSEELPSWVRVREVGWQQQPALAATGDVLAEDAVAAELRAARTPLLPSETDRFRSLGAGTARLLTEVLSGCRPEQPEREVAAAVTAGVVALGAEPLVVLVGGAERVRHRHPLPTAAPLGRRALVVVCARRDGLVINVSRWVRFGPPTEVESSADRRILEVESAFLDALRPGSTLGEVLDAGRQAYPGYGFDRDEWRRHHQGGVAGYAGRDPRATEGAPDRICLGQAFAWNPSAPGCKVEDTVLLTGDGIEVLTVDPRWPTVECAGRLRPAVLELRP